MARDSEDVFERVRRWAIPKAGRVLTRIKKEHNLPFNAYVGGSSKKREFAGAVSLSESEFEDRLRERGFEPNPVAALLSLPTNSGSEYEDGSWRYIPGDRDTQTHQLHVRLYDGAKDDRLETGKVYLFAHWEPRWDVAPIKHYRSKHVNMAKGVRRMQQHLDEMGIAYSTKWPDVYNS